MIPTPPAGRFRAMDSIEVVRFGPIRVEVMAIRWGTAKFCGQMRLRHCMTFTLCQQTQELCDGLQAGLDMPAEISAIRQG